MANLSSKCTIIDGKKLAADIRAKLADDVRNLQQTQQITPGLAVILVGKDPASEVYVRNKRRACEQAGIQSFAYDLDESSSEDELLTLIAQLNDNSNVHGILVQSPLPQQINEAKIVETISAAKDVDCFHPINVGKLMLGQKSFQPCTPAGIIEILKSIDYDLSGKRVVVVGRSNIVGKPTAMLALANNATVTICHSRTKDLAERIAEADVVISAIGKAHFIKGKWIKKGAVVIDVGINRNSDGKLIGDVEFEKATQLASAITPVPGGVGPMTIAMLLKNVIWAATNSGTN